MGRPLVSQLDNPFPQVGFRHCKAFFFQIVIKKGFFGCHRFGFNDFLYVIFFGDGGNNLIGFLGIFGNMDLGTGRFRIRFEFFKKFHKTRQGSIFSSSNFLFDTFKIDALIDCRAVFPVHCIEIV